MEEVTVLRVQPNNRKRAFEVALSGGRRYELPYGTVGITELVVDAAPDPEVGCQGFSFRTERGKSNTIPADEVLYWNRDPELLHRLMLYDLTVEAEHRAKERRLGVRQLARMLSTSPTRVQQLLDTTCTSKSVKAMVALLSVLGADVTLTVSDRVQSFPSTSRSAR